MNRKTALITGGVKGIGKITAEILAASDYNIILTYRTSSGAANQFITYLKTKYEIEAVAFQCDTAIHENCKQLVTDCVRKFVNIDIFIHNAGPYVHERKRITEYEIEEWDYIIDGNLNSFFYLSKYILPFMRKNKWGRIVTMGFDRSESAPGWKYRSAFTSAKTGLTALTKTMALEEAEHKITVNMVCPGDITYPWKEEWITAGQKAVSHAVPVGREGTGEDVGRVIAFLCSDKSDFLTGAIIPVTGGVDVLSKNN